jgi:hypothetical protein
MAWFVVEHQPQALGDLSSPLFDFHGSLRSILYTIVIGLIMKISNDSAHKRVHLLCSHCLRPTLSHDLPQATAAAHMLCR